MVGAQPTQGVHSLPWGRQGKGQPEAAVTRGRSGATGEVPLQLPRTPWVSRPPPRKPGTARSLREGVGWRKGIARTPAGSWPDWAGRRVHTSGGA